MRMFGQGHFKIKVIVQCQTHYRVFSLSVEPLVGFKITLYKCMMRRCAVRMFD